MTGFGWLDTQESRAGAAHEPESLWLRSLRPEVGREEAGGRGHAWVPIPHLHVHVLSHGTCDGLPALAGL